MFREMPKSEGEPNVEINLEEIFSEIHALETIEGPLTDEQTLRLSELKVMAVEFLEQNQ